MSLHLNFVKLHVSHVPDCMRGFGASAKVRSLELEERRGGKRTQHWSLRRAVDRQIPGEFAKSVASREIPPSLHRKLLRLEGPTGLEPIHATLWVPTHMRSVLRDAPHGEEENLGLLLLRHGTLRVVETASFVSRDLHGAYTTQRSSQSLPIFSDDCR